MADAASSMDGVFAARDLAAAAYGVVLLAGVGAWIRRAWRKDTRPIRWTRRSERLRRRAVAMSDLLGIMALVGILSLVAGSVLVAVTPDGADTDSNLLIIVSSVTLQVPVLIFAWLVAKRRGGWRRVYGVGRGAILRRQWGWGGMGLLLMMPLAAAAMAANAFAFQWAGMPLETQEVAQYLMDDAGFWMQSLKWLSAVALAPLAEEVLFRGIALPLMIRVVSAPVGVVATALVFAGIHASLSVALPLFVVGVCFAVGYLRSGSLVVPVAMHMGFNAMNLLLMSAYW